MVGVSLDEQGPAVVKSFINQLGMNYPVVMGDAKIVQDFGGIQAIPTTFIIDRSGKIVARHVGFAPKETLKANHPPLLKGISCSVYAGLIIAVLTFSQWLESCPKLAGPGVRKAPEKDS